MFRALLIITCIAAFYGATEKAHAATILDTVSGGTFGAQNFIKDEALNLHYDLIGQSFTISQSFENLVLGGVLFDSAAGTSPFFDVTVFLVSGAGVSGPVLGSSTFTLPSHFNGLHTEDFSSIGAIGPGTYTVVFSSSPFPTSSFDFFGRASLALSNTEDPFSDPYHALGPDIDLGVRDYAMLVTGDAVTSSANPVPEPSTLLLLGTGLVGLVGYRSRRSPTV